MIKSPCTNVCRMNPTTQYCYGCKRTITEISNWIKFTDIEKNQVLEEIKKR
jgi:predicted Fe-S protein YdhL (DUF1289 family)